MYYKERFETYLDVDEMLDKYYNYDETYRKCSQCPGFGETWVCPDFNFDPKALAAQECTLCKKCVRLSGHPCVHPDKMRYALESLGMLAVICSQVQR